LKHNFFSHLVYYNNIKEHKIPENKNIPSKEYKILKRRGCRDILKPVKKDIPPHPPHPGQPPMG
jgi:hypothetical protein